MKIALIGYGKMGQMIEKVALAAGHSIVARLASPDWKKEMLEEAEICIEFTRPESVLENVRKAAEAKKEVVIGTTGWYDKLEVVESIVKENEIGVLYGPNFSVGVNLFFEIVAQASKIMNGFVDYDVAGIDYHHRNKKDSPSGTAMQMASIVEENIDHIGKVPFSSVRCGSIPGIHTLLFDSPCDAIVLTHESRNREGFAKGALQAAAWLRKKKGLYTFTDYMKENRSHEKK